MKYLLTLLVFGLTMCTGDILPDQKFSGSFNGNQDDVSLTAVLSVKDNVLNGTVILNGKPTQLLGLINGSLSEGTFYDAEAERSYPYTGKLAGDELRLSVTFPQFNDEVIEVIMHRQADGTSLIERTSPSSKTPASPATESAAIENMAPENTAPESTLPEEIAPESIAPESKSPSKTTVKINPALVGVWRITEDFSSGSGDNYGSFSTEYFMQFKADGTFLSWTGKSAGSGGDLGISIEGESAADAIKGEWATEEKTLYLIDPATKEKVSTLFYAEENRMMLHDGAKNRKVFQRVR